MQLLRNIYYQDNARLILDDIHLTATPGQVVAVMGPSGCGKTTLLKLLAGLLTPTAGEISANWSPIAYVFQESRLLPWYNTIENITLGLQAKGMPVAQQLQLACTLASLVGLGDATHLYPRQLSGGMQQRVNLARALVVNPRLLLLDEPFSSLDLGVRQQLQQRVVEWTAQHETVTVLVTHDLSEAILMADRLFILSPRPARVVYQWENPRSHSQRDLAYIDRTLSLLKNLPEFAASFGVEPVLSSLGE
ncbi:ATP-binding cassette domain-containing protein [Spirulina sp. CS-785/01]|uniref:ABC transporter ATP-binding protein n=1 Tax=Spirulina sp. CS-785/01 TaxID=3021716 RepID=UPI00232E0F7D|nr:ATP-binding cassette domain-containing protein [Spirulina sp. CS-785/01]MDB9313278.1 ATP-binding cassette domain-containing protein [Spirulina sp. CS-785/01]